MRIVVTENQLKKLSSDQEKSLKLELGKKIITQLLSEEFGICKIEAEWVGESGSFGSLFKIFVDEDIAKSRNLRENLVDEAWLLIKNLTGLPSYFNILPCE